MTRQEMHVQWLNPDHTMFKLIEPMYQCQITDHVIKNLKCAPEDTWTKPEKPMPETTEDISLNNSLSESQDPWDPNMTP